MRKALTKTVRFEVFKRDEFTCQYCGGTPPRVVLQVDHIVAVANGGKNHIDNYVTACQPCNLGKGTRSLLVVPQSLANKSKDIAESEAQLLGYQAILEEKRQRIDAEMWRVAELLKPGSRKTGIPRTDAISIRRFVEQLGVFVVLGAAEKALTKRINSEYELFRYFFGICWSILREQKEEQA